MGLPKHSPDFSNTRIHTAALKGNCISKKKKINYNIHITHRSVTITDCYLTPHLELLHLILYPCANRLVPSKSAILVFVYLTGPGKFLQCKFFQIFRQFQRLQNFHRAILTVQTKRRAETMKKFTKIIFQREGIPRSYPVFHLSRDDSRLKNFYCNFISSV